MDIQRRRVISINGYGGGEIETVRLTFENAEAVAEWCDGYLVAQREREDGEVTHYAVLLNPATSFILGGDSRRAEQGEWVASLSQNDKPPLFVKLSDHTIQTGTELIETQGPHDRFAPGAIYEDKKVRVMANGVQIATAKMSVDENGVAVLREYTPDITAPQIGLDDKLSVENVSTTKEI